jgi:putative sugar O-methyltransferase
MNPTETFAADMMTELQSADPLFLPSAFWRELNEDNRRMLVHEGLANFKRTISNNYFNWLITDHKSELFRHAFRQWLRRPDLLPLRTRLVETRHLRTNTADGLMCLNTIQRHTYRLYVCFVWTIMEDLDRHNLRLKITEPQVGNPLPVMLGTKLLSQDLATSIMECNLIADLVQNLRSPRVAELGAGYGRLAHVYANALPGQYFIFDIPPALSVAQWYLEQTLGAQRVFRFRRFDRFDDVRNELDRASVALFTSNQISKFPAHYFDVMVSISTLPEMRHDQVDFYLSEFERLSRGHIFLKQFTTWRNPNDGTELSRENYRFSSDWSLMLDRTDPVISEFFNRVWQRKLSIT